VSKNAFWVHIFEKNFEKIKNFFQNRHFSGVKFNKKYKKT